MDTLEFLAVTIEQEAVDATPTTADEDYDEWIKRIEQRKKQIVRNIVEKCLDKSR